MCSLWRSLKTEDIKKDTPSDGTEGVFLYEAVISARRKQIKKLFSYFLAYVLSLTDNNITKILWGTDIYASGSSIIY